MRRAGWLAGLAAVMLVTAGRSAGQSSSVTIDDQPTTEQNLARINDLRRAGRYDDAADFLQELVDGSRFKLVTVGPGAYLDAELWARRELSRDWELLRAYRERYTASAERALATAHEDGSLRAVREAYRRFGMTRPGLDAGLSVAARLLERGEPAAAGVLLASLSRHPDQGEVRARLFYLRGISAAMNGRPDEAGDFAAQLRLLDPALSDRLSAMSESLDPPASRGTEGLVDAGPRPEGLDVPLWEAPIADPAGRARSRFDGLRSLPVAFGESVLVNTGRQVTALDRASGEPLWSYPPEVAGGRQFQMNQPTWLDTRGLAVSAGRVYAVVGDCRGIQGRGGVETVQPNLLVCLDHETGELRWSRAAGEVYEGEPSLLDDPREAQGTLQQTHFVGTPVTAQGQVFSLIRKTNVNGNQTTWLAAFDATSGRMHWYRHVALVQVRHGQDAVRITPQLLVEGDALYLTDQVAVAASIDIHSGAYRWLRVLADDRARAGNNLTILTEGTNTPPVLTPSGLVVQLSLVDQRLFLLDPESGRTLRELHDDPQLRMAQYLLDAGDDVLIVSLAYVMLWNGTTGEVEWTYAFEQGDKMRGRGAVTQAFAVLPTQRGIVALRLSDGEAIAEVGSLAGNLVALGSEVLVTTTGKVQSYMSWDGAYKRLLQRVERSPRDPGPGMSLASLALARGEPGETVLEGLGYALAAVERSQGEAGGVQRQRLFDGLRRMADGNSRADDALRSRVFDLMAVAAETAEQTAAYHLDLAEHLARRGDPEGAVRHLQSVMIDPVLSSAGYGHLGGSAGPGGGSVVATSPAGATAQRELLALVREYGRVVYRRYDALAEQELASLLAVTEPDPVALSLLAKRYPLAASASRALLMAAERLEVSGQRIGALSQYQQALASAITAEQRLAAASAVLGYYERSARPTEALSLIDRLAQEDTTLRPVRAGVETTLDEWRGVFTAVAPAGGADAALAHALGRPIVLPGRLLLPPPGADPSVLGGALLIHTAEGEVAMLDGANHGTARWSTRVAGRQLYALSHDHGQLLVWSVDAQQLTALDSSTGERMWDAPVGLAALGADEAAGGRRALPETLPWFHVGPTVVCFVGPSGQALGIDRYRGTVRWASDTGVGRVSAVAADPWTLVIAGVVGPELDLNHGKLVLLDLYSGNPVLDRIDLHVGFLPRVVGLGGGAMIAVSQTRSEVSVFDAVTGESRWRQALSDQTATGRGLAHRGLLAVEDTSGIVYVLSTRGDAGSVRARCRLGDNTRFGSATLRPLADGMLAYGRRAAVMLDGEGRLAWQADAPTSSGAIHAALPAASRVAIIASTDSAADPDRLLAQGETVTYQVDLLDRAGGRLLSSYTVGPIAGQLDPRRAAVASGGIAIAMGTQTLYLPPEPDTTEPGGEPR